MPDQLDEDVKAKRQDELMQLRQEIAFEISDSMVGPSVGCPGGRPFAGG